MATTTLTLDECEPNALPPVCVKCGAEATCEKAVKFTWQPPWIIVTILAGLLIYAILSVILTKRRLAHMPVCDRHGGVWNWGSGIAYFVLFGWLIILLAPAFVLAPGQGKDYVGQYYLWSVGLLIVGIIVAAVVQSCGIKAKHITDDDLKLTRLNADFVAALEDQRDAVEAEYRARRSARRAARGLA
jgi:hypothetical protein